MKTIYFLACLIYSNLMFSQKPTFICSYYGNNSISEEIIKGKLPKHFVDNKEAIATVDRIIQPTGLKRNFIIMEDSRVANACALIHNELRYVLYNNNFMEMVKNVTNNDWSEASIMAHEIGHHLQGHTALSSGSRPDIELEADEYSGWIMYMLGASLQDAQTAMSNLASETDSETHPGRFKRLNAIQVGWSRAAKQFPRQEKSAVPIKTITYAAQFMHNSQKAGFNVNGNPYQANLYLSASADELNSIESVTYHLHETFSEPNITVTDVEDGFSLKISLWGEFEATATVRYKDGTTKTLKRYLSL